MADKGRPKAFSTAEDFINRFQAYLVECEKSSKLPNVAGFCTICGITRETYYKQKEYYSDTFKRIELALEDSALNADIAPAVKIFYLKNKFKDDYKDKQEIEQINTNIDLNLSDEEKKARILELEQKRKG